jgi:hypothetical protein
MGKGITLNVEEIVKLKDLLAEINPEELEA